MITLLTDLSVLVIYTFNVFFLEKSIKREKKRIDDINYEPGDYAVKIGNIPDKLGTKDPVEVK